MSNIFRVNQASTELLLDQDIGKKWSWCKMPDCRDRLGYQMPPLLTILVPSLSSSISSVKPHNVNARV